MENIENAKEEEMDNNERTRMGEARELSEETLDSINMYDLDKQIQFIS